MSKSKKNNEFIANGIILQKTSNYADSISLTAAEIKNAKEGRYAGIALCQTDGTSVSHSFISNIDTLLTQVKRYGPGWTAYYTQDCVE